MRAVRRSALALLLCAATDASAQELPTATYTTAHGLTHDVVMRLLHDPRGFLWVAGIADLARFDGERFVSYGRADGLDVGTAINALAFGPAGDLWVATNGAGLYRFDLHTDDRGRRFTRYPVGADRQSNRVNTIGVSEDGTVWAGTDAGLFVGRPESFTRVRLQSPDGTWPETSPVMDITLHRSRIWVGTIHGVYACTPPAECRPVGRQGVRALVVDHQERLWFVRRSGIEIWTLAPSGMPDRLVEVIGADWAARRIVATSNGMLVVTEDRRVIWTDTVTSRVLYTLHDALRLNDVWEDSSGNLWIATNRGLVSIRRQGVTLFPEDRRLWQSQLRSIRAGAGGAPYVFSEDHRLHRIDGDSISSIRMHLPPGVGQSLWAYTAVTIDRDGDVWLGSGRGLFWYPRPRFSTAAAPDAAPISAGRVYTAADGLAGEHIAEIFEDSRRDVWISNVPAGGDTLTVWRRAPGHLERLGTNYGLPEGNQLGGFVEDPRGVVWAKLREGGIVRLDPRRATVFRTERGLPSLVTALAFDAAGGLWIAGGDSVLRVRDPRGETLDIEPVLSDLGTTVLSLAIDPRGKVFAGTYAGLLSFDPADGSIGRYSTFDGIPRGGVDYLVVEPTGALLLAVGPTVVRLRPDAARSLNGAPRCLLTAVRIGGRLLPMAEAGVETLQQLRVQPSQNQIEISFVGLSPRFGEPLQYQYRLPGVSDEWTDAPERRAVFAGLASGRYTFEARVAGASISQPATVVFTVLPPWYRSWWFLSLAALALTGVAFAAHRARLANALRTERLRARIATDLHDDIGSSLSQIAILAEVAQRRAGGALPAVTEPLSSIASTSRDLVDSMSDIVWAVNPRTDTLEDLVRRMHRFAEETLGGADIALTFSAPSSDGQMRLDPDLRRELYLILKESVNNIARHSGATEARVELTVGRSEMRLVIADNGRGFDPSARTDGNGVGSMRKRAALFGGVFRIESAPGRGTQVSLTANLRPKQHYAST